MLDNDGVYITALILHNERVYFHCNNFCILCKNVNKPMIAEAPATPVKHTTASAISSHSISFTYHLQPH